MSIFVQWRYSSPRMNRNFQVHFNFLPWESAPKSINSWPLLLIPIFIWGNTAVGPGWRQPILCIWCVGNKQCHEIWSCLSWDCPRIDNAGWISIDIWACFRWWHWYVDPLVFWCWVFPWPNHNLYLPSQRLPLHMVCQIWSRPQCLGSSCSNRFCSGRSSGNRHSRYRCPHFHMIDGNPAWIWGG